MGGDETYFFSPAAQPFNPNLSAAQIRSYELIGRYNAAAFDARGEPYFTREVYDLFYPGYGDTWNAHQGAIGHVRLKARIAFAVGDGTKRRCGIGFTAAVDVEHIVAAFDREPHNGRSDKSATASYEDAHQPQPPGVNDCAAPG